LRWTHQLEFDDAIINFNRANSLLPLHERRKGGRGETYEVEKELSTNRVMKELLPASVSPIKSSLKRKSWALGGVTTSCKNHNYVLFTYQQFSLF
jgi:hypothetical protein